MRTDEELLDEIENANGGAGPSLTGIQYRGQALKDLASAVEARSVADSAIVDAVFRARAEGATWQMIGDMLGVTRQGALKRYGAAAA